jgi:hypothetical protein
MQRHFKVNKIKQKHQIKMNPAYYIATIAFICLLSQYVIPSSIKKPCIPIIDEIQLGDTLTLNKNLEDFLGKSDSVIRLRLNNWFYSNSSSVDKPVPDSIKFIQAGYSFVPKLVRMNDSTDQNGFDLYRGKTCIAKNLVRPDWCPIEYDTSYHSYILPAYHYSEGQTTGTFVYNDNVIYSDNLSRFGTTPKLFKGKPLYIVRSNSIIKSDSLSFFNLTYPDFSQNGSDPKFKVSYPFTIKLGSKVVFCFKYSFVEYLDLFPEHINCRTLVFNNGWSFEYKNHMVINGIDVANKNGYSECFYSGVIDESIFFFYKKDNYYGIQYNDYCFPVKYDNVFYNGCCSQGFINPRYAQSKKAVRFFAVKGNYWYLVIVHM